MLLRRGATPGGQFNKTHVYQAHGVVVQPQSAPEQLHPDALGVLAVDGRGDM